MTPVLKPLPVPQPESDRYWEGTRRGELWLRRCTPCAEAYFYPRDLCPRCMSRDVVWTKATGKATLHTFAIAHRAPHPGFEGDLPYVPAIVRLEEGPMVPTVLVGAGTDPAAIRIGMGLTAVYEQASESITLLKFRPA